jgi:predicted patatin/cPLA2 family phospholipase
MKTATEYIKYLEKFGYTITKEPFKYKALQDFDGCTSFFEFNEEHINEEESFEQICLVNQNEEVLLLTCDSLVTVIEDGKLNIDKMLDNAIVDTIEIEIPLGDECHWIILDNVNSQYYENNFTDQWNYKCNKIILPDLLNLEYVLTHILPNPELYKNEYIQKSLEHRNYIIKEFVPVLQKYNYYQACDFLIDDNVDNIEYENGNKKDISLGYLYCSKTQKLQIHLCTDFITQKLLIISDNFVYKGDIIDNKFNIEESIEFDKLKKEMKNK